MRRLTRRTDILHALAGLVTKFENILNDTYLNGLWQNDLRIGLSWTIDYGGKRLSSLPSWSWASVACERDEPGPPFMSQKIKYPKNYEEFVDFPEHLHTKSTIIEPLQIEGSGTNNLSTTHLSVRGFMKIATVSNESGSSQIVTPEGDLDLGFFSHDEEDSEATDNGRWNSILWVQIFDSDATYNEYWLGLVPVFDIGERHYKRIGLWRISSGGRVAGIHFLHGIPAEKKSIILI